MSVNSTQLLYSKQEAMKFLGVGERTFRGLTVPYVTVGKRKKYALEDLQTFINRNRQDPACLSPAKGKARRTTGTILPWPDIGIEEARRQIALNRRNQSLQS